MAHENAGGHGYSLHVAMSPSFIYGRTLSGVTASTAFWDFAKPNTNSTADNILINALNGSFFWLSERSKSAVHNDRYYIIIPAIVPRDSGNVTVLLPDGQRTFSFTSTTGYGFTLDVLTARVRPVEPKGMVAVLACNVFSPILNVPYTIITAYPTFFE